MSGGRRHEVVRTRGGAAAMRSLVDGEVMHPGVGPLVEADRLYVRQSRLAERLQSAPRPHVVVFDVGLGAGSNALAAWAVSERAGPAAARLTLISFERDLDALELAIQHAPELLASDAAMADAAAVAARAFVDDGRYETARTSWRLERGDVLESLDRLAALADVVFWDPYSPRANPGLWTVAAFAAARRRAQPGAALFTYSASTAIRVALLLAGWAVGVGDAIGDKRATTAAAADPRDLARPLDRRWLARLSRPDVPLPADAPPDVARLVAALPQFSERAAPAADVPHQGW